MNTEAICCDALRAAVDDPDVPISTWSKYREVGISVLDGGTSMVAFHFCPFCGKALPESLRDIWFNVMESMGIDPGEDPVPDAFRDGRWYKSEKEMDL